MLSLRCEHLDFDLCPVNSGLHNTHTVCHGVVLLSAHLSHVLNRGAIKNVYAFVADVVLLLVSLPVCEKLDGYLHRYVLKKNCGKAEGA